MATLPQSLPAGKATALVRTAPPARAVPRPCGAGRSACLSPQAASSGAARGHPAGSASTHLSCRSPERRGSSCAEPAARAAACWPAGGVLQFALGCRWNAAAWPCRAWLRAWYVRRRLRLKLQHAREETLPKPSASWPCARSAIQAGSRAAPQHGRGVPPARGDARHCGHVNAAGDRAAAALAVQPVHTPRREENDDGTQTDRCPTLDAPDAPGPGLCGWGCHPRPRGLWPAGAQDNGHRRALEGLCRAGVLENAAGQRGVPSWASGAYLVRDDTYQALERTHERDRDHGLGW